MSHYRRGFALLLLLSLALFIAQADKPIFRLQLLHFSDMDGDDADVLENVGNLSALVSSFRQELPDNTLVLSAGDNYIPGLRYNASANPKLDLVLGIGRPGRADVALLNALRVHASAVGNHELDEGPTAFVQAITAEHHPDAAASFPGARFPFLSANIDFTTDAHTADLVAPNGQNVLNIPARLVASAFVELAGEKIGLVGAATPDFLNITATGGLAITPNDFDATDDISLDALAANLQGAVNELTAASINKIVLVAHMQQLAIEKALAPRLRDVDIIIAGGSNTLLADADDRLRPGDRATGTYPLVFRSPTGNAILVVNTAGDYSYLGRLVVDFNSSGRILSNSLDTTNSGAYATDHINASGTTGPMPDVVAISSALAAVFEDDSSDGSVLGHSSVLLEGRREKVRTEETNLGNLAADANLDLARLVDASTLLSLTTGGVIRAGIEAGPISQFDIKNTLSFNNDLILVTVTTPELITLIEHGVAASRSGATPGQFPQVGGLSFSFDLTQPGVAWHDASDCDSGANPSFGALSRVVDLVVLASKEPDAVDTVVRGGLLQGSPGRRFRLVTSRFLVAGGDGYPYPCLSAPELVSLREMPPDDGTVSFAPAGTEQDALAEFLQKNFFTTPYDRAETVAAEDSRIRHVR